MTRSKSLLLVLAGIGLAAFGLFRLTRTEAPPAALPPQASPSSRGEPLLIESAGPSQESARRAETEPSSSPTEPPGVPAMDPEDAKTELLAELDESLKSLHSRDPAERLSAIGSLVDLDPEVAERELEALLRGPEQDDEVRLEAFEELKDLAQGREAVAVLIEGLHDRSAVVRSEAASLLQLEDVESDDRILPALRETLLLERDPDVRDELEAALESVDPTAGAETPPS